MSSGAPTSIIDMQDVSFDTSLYYSFGFPNAKRNNIHLIESNVVVLSVGNTLQFFNLRSRTYHWIEVQGQDGIGSIAVHPSKKFIAVAVVGKEPDVYIYSYPALEIHKTLKKGTSVAYSTCCFNKSGTMLATVGSHPDYMLTIWNWEEEKISLRYKAFGQDVFNVSFSDTNDGQLVTSGVGHIKFWKMAQTFTGLKLQGQIGKFGKVDISDIYGYCILPDGKVLSGSERGNMLLWEGNLIKSIVMKPGGLFCHDGKLEVVIHDGSKIVTGGSDGYIRYWNFEQIDRAEPSDDNNSLEILPEFEHQIGPNVKIVSLVRSDDFWLVLDASGALWQVNFDLGNHVFISEKILEFHAGPVTDVSPSPHDHTALTIGLDGTLRLIDYNSRKSLYLYQCSAGATKAQWNPKEIDPSETTATVSFDDGTIRIVQRCSDGFLLVKVKKPHTSPITDFSFSRDGELLVTGSKDKTLFFFDKKLEPFGFASVPEPIRSLDWSLDNRTLFVALANDCLLRVNIPDLSHRDSADSLEIELSYDSLMYHQCIEPKKTEVEGDSNNENGDMEDQPKDKRKQVDHEENIRKQLLKIVCIKDSGQQLLVSLNCNEGLLLYNGRMWSSYDPMKPLQVGDKSYEYAVASYVQNNVSPCTSVMFSSSGKYVVLGYKDGKVRIFDKNSYENGKFNRELKVRGLHDSIQGRINKATLSFDDSYLLSVGNDGGIFVQRILNESITQHPEMLLPSKIGTQAQFSMVKDIIDPCAFSIHQEKLKSKEDQKKSDTETRKEERRNRISELRTKYFALVESNNRREEHVRLTRDELQLDKTVKEKVEKMTQEKLEVARKVLEWDSTWTDIKLKKLKDTYIDCLDVERIVLKAFESGHEVESYKTPKIRPILQQLIDHFHAKINEEILKKQKQIEQSENISLSEAISDIDTPQESHQSSRKRPPWKRETQKHVPGEKALEVKKKRKERMIIKDSLLSREPQSTDEDLSMVEEITSAQQNMGDYKLRTDDNFSISDHSRITADKKLRQMILLEESMHTLRMVFNVRVLGLRDLKQRLIDKFKQYHKQVNDINKQLGIADTLEMAPLARCEIPEDRENISMELILEYEQKMLAEQRRLTGHRTNLGNFSMGGSEVHKDELTVQNITPMTSKARRDTAKEKNDERKARVVVDTLSELEKNELSMNKLTLEYEKDRILRKRQKQIESFDAAIDELQREKYILDSDLKHADLRLLLAFHELKILKTFEQKDNIEYSELSKKLRLRQEISNKIVEITSMLSKRKEEISNLNIERIKRDYNELVAEKHPAREELNRIFKRSTSDNDSDDDEDEDEEDNLLNKDEKPDSCDQQLFEQILSLRQERIEQEKFLENILNSVELYKKEIEKNQRDLRTIDLDRTKIERRIRDIQLEKQNHINELHMVVVLKLNQIQSLIQNKIPADLSDHIVFTKSGLKKLVKRIQTLNEERKQLRVRHNDLQKNQKALLKEQKTREDDYSFAKNKVREVQLLKFGKEIDIEELEKAAENSGIVALESELKKNENEAHEILTKWDEKIAESKEQLISATTENTRLLSTLASLRQRQQELENELDVSQTTMVHRITKTLTNVKVDRRKRMQDIALEQTRNIEACKQEISLLSRKVPPQTTTMMSPGQ